MSEDKSPRYVKHDDPVGCGCVVAVQPDDEAACDEHGKWNVNYQMYCWNCQGYKPVIEFSDYQTGLALT